MNTSPTSPLGKLNHSHPRLAGRRKRRLALALSFLATILIGLGLSAVSAANISFTGESFLTVGSTALNPCGPDTEISFVHSINSGGMAQIDSVRVDGISSDCDGEVVALVLYDSNSAIVDEIVWTLALTTGDAGIAAVADGSSTDSSNSSQEGTSTNYPGSQSSPEGLATGQVASAISGVEFLILEGPRAARQ